MDKKLFVTNRFDIDEVLVLWDTIQSEEAKDDAKKDVFYEGCGCT